MLFLKNYLDLCKLKVVYLMLLCALVGMFLASNEAPNLKLLILGCLGIGLTSASGAAFNHVIDRKIDAKMYRTKDRPIPKYAVSHNNALLFGLFLSLIGLSILYFGVNSSAALWSLIALISYSFIYTAILKPLTSQNIVIGGLSGALPPLLGWLCINPYLSAEPWLLVLIIFVWTPPHFWALAIAKIDDYKKIDIPMLPVTHGIEYTKINIMLYAVLLFAATALPYVINMFSGFYLFISFMLNVRFAYLCYKLKKCNNSSNAMQVFLFSILYLIILFITMLIDHFLFIN